MKLIKKYFKFLIYIIPVVSILTENYFKGFIMFSYLFILNRYVINPDEKVIGSSINYKDKEF